MIGEKIIGANNLNEKITGIIIDKFSGLERVNQDYPSGNGGKVSVKQYIQMDYYLVETSSGIDKIKCSNVYKILKTL